MTDFTDDITEEKDSFSQNPVGPVKVDPLPTCVTSASETGMLLGDLLPLQGVFSETLPGINSENSEASESAVSARGTEDGLVLRIDGRAVWERVIADVELFLGERRRFFAGGKIAVEWLDRLPTREQSKQLEELLKVQYGMEIMPRRLKPVPERSISGKALPGANTANQVSKTVLNKGSLSKQDAALIYDGALEERSDEKKRGITIPLFDEPVFPNLSGSEASGSTINRQIDPLGDPTFDDPLFSGALSLGENVSKGSRRDSKQAPSLSRVSRLLGDDLFFENDANAKAIFGTLRSGQRIETPFSLIVVGDVNPGADLVAGGDIVIFGSLKGTAHAAAYDDESYDRVIIALHMQPMQLRIGSVISRGSDEVVRGAEIARIENRRIIVEAFNPRMPISRKLR